jgi:uncharacterized protein (TIGR00725 family)
MKTKVGVMGSAGNAEPGDSLAAKAQMLGRAFSSHDVILLTGATTGVIYLVGKAAHDAGVLHIGVSPASSLEEHLNHYRLPSDACDALIYTGFGLKGRNVVLVRSCDVVLFIAGKMGSLNEFTIAHDEGKIIGCLTQTGGVADQVKYLAAQFSKQTNAQLFYADDPEELIATCLSAKSQRQRSA